MINLAGEGKCDQFIEQELKIAKINLVKNPLGRSEVPFTITGALGEFTFHRAWYYWVVKGPLPLEAALKLYQDPDCKNTVRVSGHCGCPPPEAPWITWRDDEGNTVIPMKEKADFDRYIEKGLLKPDCLNGKRFDEHPENYRGFIESYHIDTQLGLCRFADMVRELELKAVAR